MYRSKLEERVAHILLVERSENWDYEEERYIYTLVREYTPDFTYRNIVIEVKGYFRIGDQMKYRAIARHLRADGRRFILVFSDSNKPVRKGAKLTHGKWCEKNDVEYCNIRDLKEYLDDTT